MNSDLTLKLDEDGDGNFDEDLQPTSILDENDSGDIMPPETSINVSGNKKRDYFIQALVELVAEDDNSGVLKTKYSINDSPWHDYTEPFKLDKTAYGNEVTIRYFSTDKAGNPEAIKEKTILNIGLELQPVEGEPIIIYPNP